MSRPIAAALLLTACAIAAAERPADAAPPRGRLRSVPCLPGVSTSTASACALDVRGEPRRPPAALAPAPQSYFAEHAERVERDLVRFQHDYTLDRMRARDAYLLYGQPAGGPRAIASGIALFSSVVVGAAHAPAPLRVFFDNRLHLGPALFDGGGLGGGLGGSL